MSYQNDGQYNNIVIEFQLADPFTLKIKEMMKSTCGEFNLLMKNAARKPFNLEMAAPVMSSVDVTLL